MKSIEMIILIMVKIFDNSTIYTVPEVADRLKRPEATIRCRVFHRKIPYSKMNGSVIFIGQRLNEWLDDCQVEKEGTVLQGGTKRQMKKTSKKVSEEFAQFVDKLK